MDNKLTKKYGLLTAICMVVGIVIGSGVFFKAQAILDKTGGNMGLGILAWIIGGVIMMICSYTFSIMATKYEKVNGLVDYAEVNCGKGYAYYVGWFMTMIYYPTLSSVLAWLSARYTCVVFGFANAVTGSETMLLAGFYLIAAYCMNALSPKLAGKFQVSATIIKMIPLVLMAIVGTIFGLVKGITVDNFVGAATTIVSENSSLFGAIVATSFAYEGWIIATSINTELKDAKRNLPKALTLGSVIVIVVYIAYFIGVAGGAPVSDLISDGATVAYINVFGVVGGAILNAFVAVSCLGTLNGLMLGCTRGLYALSARNLGPSPETFKQVDSRTNMPTNSSIFGLLLCAIWLVFFYGANLTDNWFGVFAFDSSELPIITIYAMYIPIFVKMIIKEKDMSVFKRFVMPILAILGCVFMVFAAVWAHGIIPLKQSLADGTFVMPVLFYLIIFGVIEGIGSLFLRHNRKTTAISAEVEFATGDEETTPTDERSE